MYVKSINVTLKVLMLRCLPLPLARQVEKFRFITIKGNSKKYVKLKVEQSEQSETGFRNYIRGYSTDYYDHNNNLLQQIVYPKELWLTPVDQYDPIEQKIEKIKKEIPDWSTIVIIKIK